MGYIQTEEQLTTEVIREAIDALTKAACGGKATDLATTLANQHPTLLGALAKSVAIGVMRRVTYNPEWRAFDPTTNQNLCLRRDRHTFSLGFGDRVIEAEHPEHDGRIDCATVVAADLMARQSFI